MIFSEIGYIALLLAFVIAVCQVVLPSIAFVGRVQQLPSYSAFLLSLAPSMAIAQSMALAISFVCLMMSFYVNDYSVVYVASHSNSLLPWYYKLSATWGGHEGSLLLWVLILSIWCAAFAVCYGGSRSHSYQANLTAPLASSNIPASDKTPLTVIKILKARALVVMAAVQVAMLSLVIFSSSPFDRAFPVPVDGADLNPLLQDPGLIMHPPMLYLGYVGMVVPFAVAVAALWSAELRSEWAGQLRPWVLVALGFLTLGIALGSWWAYYELGWGGWWFWDPVENASLMPWLAAVALLHVLAVVHKRDTFKAWAVLLSILAFGLSLLGTFLVRSGVLSSVHSFASDPTRGLFILSILGMLVGGALSLFAWRGWRLQSTGRYALRSRETVLAINNMLLMTSLIVVVLGTLYPIIADAFGWGQVSVGAPYFNTLLVPLAWLMLFVLGLAPMLRWQKDTQPLFGKICVLAVSSVFFACMVYFILVQQAPWTMPRAVLMTLVLGLWVVLWALYSVWQRLRQSDNLWSAIVSLPLSYWSMQLAHFGLVVLCLGIAFTSHFSVKKDVAMAVGETVEIPAPYSITQYMRHYNGLNDMGDGANVSRQSQHHQQPVTRYRVHFDRMMRMDALEGVAASNQPRQKLTEQAVSQRVIANYDATVARFIVTYTGGKHEKSRVVLLPEKRRYFSHEQVMTEAAIDASPWRDIYIAMGEPVVLPDSHHSAHTWAIRVHIKPLVRWIWGGAVMIALASLLAAVSVVHKRKKRQ